MFGFAPTKNFIGEIPDSAYEFRTSAPTVIGKILSGHSTVKVGKRIPSKQENTIHYLIAAVVGLLLAVVIIYFFSVYKLGWQIALCIVLPIIGLVIKATMMNFHHYFLGENGLADVEVKADDEEPKETILLFKDAANLVKGLTDRYKNFVYQGTDFSFQWFDEAGIKLFDISGTYQDKGGNPKYQKSYQYYWGVEAEKVWTNYIFDKALNQIKSHGFYEFGSKNGDKYRLGHGFIEKINSKGKSFRIDEKDITRSYAEKGSLYIKTKEGFKWFNESSIVITFNDIHNSKIFLSLYFQMIKVPE